MELFIEDVKKHPELYDKKHKNYLNSKRKGEIWKHFSKKYQINAKKKWTYLRDHYTKLKKTYDSPSRPGGAKEDVRWEHYDQLSFLEDHLQLRRTRQSIIQNNVDLFSEEISELSEEISDQPEQYDQYDDPIHIPIHIPEANDDNSSSTETYLPDFTPLKRKREDKVQNVIMETLKSLSESIKALTDDKKDYTSKERHFLKLIEGEMEEMDDEDRIEFKRKVFNEATNYVQNTRQKQSK